MVLVVYGFATHTSALQFEWAWQHPERSLDVRDAVARVGRKARYGIAGKVLLLMEILNSSPWKYFPLHVMFLSGEHARLQAGSRPPPPHMFVHVGPLEDVPYDSDDDGEDATEPHAGPFDNSGLVFNNENILLHGNIEESISTDLTILGGSETGEEVASGLIVKAPVGQGSQKEIGARKKRKNNACALCNRAATRSWAVCEGCGVRTHIECLAECFLVPPLTTGVDKTVEGATTLPNNGRCPSCQMSTKWIDVLKGMRSVGWGGRRRNGQQSDVSNSAPVPARRPPLDEDEGQARGRGEVGGAKRAPAAAGKCPSNEFPSDLLHVEMDDRCGFLVDARRPWDDYCSSSGGREEEEEGTSSIEDHADTGELSMSICSVQNCSANPEDIIDLVSPLPLAQRLAQRTALIAAPGVIDATSPEIIDIMNGE